MAKNIFIELSNLQLFFNARQLALFLATSVIARLRNPRMSAFAKRVSAVFVHSGAKANNFMRLNHLDICMSHDQVIRDEVEAGKYTIQRCCCGKDVNLTMVSIVDSLLSALHVSANRIFAL